MIGYIILLVANLFGAKAATHDKDWVAPEGGGYTMTKEEQSQLKTWLYQVERHEKDPTFEVTAKPPKIHSKV